MAERVEMALQAILDKAGSEGLPAPKSRNEVLLHEIADMIAQGGTGVKSYSDLEDKPTINGVEIDGDKTSEDFGFVSDDDFDTELAKKLDRNQGAENNGKILGIGSDGNIVPVAPSGGGIINDNAITTENAWSAKKIDDTKENRFAKSGTFDGANLKTVFPNSADMFSAIDSGIYDKIHVGDYYPITLNGSYRDWGAFTVPSGVTYYTDDTLQTEAGTTDKAYEGSYKSETAVQVNIGGNKFVAFDDCLPYFERTITNALINLEVAAINPYWRYGDSGGLTGNEEHVLFVSRDCLPQTLRMRKENNRWENVVGIETFTGDGSTKDFTLSESTYRIGGVWINGTLQTWNTHYTVSNNKVTIKTAPAANAEIKVEALSSDNPWLGSALFKTLNDTEHGIIALIQAADPTLYARIYKGASGNGMRYYGDLKTRFVTSNSSGWCDRGVLFLPTEDEIWGRVIFSQNTYTGQLQLPIFAGSRRHVSKGIGNGASRSTWWSMSANSGSSATFCSVSYYGIPYASYAGNSYGAPVCFLLS